MLGLLATYCVSQLACVFTVTVGPAGAGYTAVDPESRRVVPTAAERQGKVVVKMVYVVLEAQYQVMHVVSRVDC
jgi:hypothetical protein